VLARWGSSLKDWSVILKYNKNHKSQTAGSPCIYAVSSRHNWGGNDNKPSNSNNIPPLFSEARAPPAWALA